MSLPSRTEFGRMALLCACCLAPAALTAQTGTKVLTSTPTNPTVTRAQALPSPAPPRPMPPLGSKTGIAFFRELLAMNPFERNQALTNFSATTRAQILAKVKEYESLPPDERELRLRVTELHAYLQPLMNTRDTNRAAQLARIPEPDRKLVEDRLREWDTLSPEVQRGLLEHQATLLYLAQIRGLTDEQRRIILANIPPARRAMLEQGISKWNAMSEDERRNMLDRFNEFFELTPAEKEKALQTLSEPERRQIEKTLRAFGSLRPSQREAAIHSFAKFASLSIEERQKFLKDAERWERMPPSEREAWREVVRRIPPLPPLPPPRPPRPHLPPPALVTNGN